MMMRLDLHTHSTFSDGKLSPQQLMVRAHACQIDVLALTDHDTLAGLPEAREHATILGIQLISGIEISTQWHYQKGGKQNILGVHVVGLNIDETHLGLAELLVKQQYWRGERAQLICQRLVKVLKVDLLPDVLSLVDDKIECTTRAHIAQVIVDRGFAKTHQQVFDRWLGLGKAAYVAGQWINLSEAIRIIHEAGGVAVLAHPSRYQLTGKWLRVLMQAFCAAGGDAAELPALRDTAGIRDVIHYEIKALGLQVSVGSDFHGDHMPWNGLGQTPPISADMTPIWQNWI